MPRYGSVDIGSNSVRMMVAEVDGDRLEILAEDRKVTRLGGGVFFDGAITREALDVLCTMLATTATAFAKLEVSAARAVATSAVRDANNQAEFLSRVEAALGFPVEIVSGVEEARLIHLGVQSRWPQSGRVLMIDVGGGSTEFILSNNGRVEQAFSKPLGAVRLTEVFLKHDPPTVLELRQMAEYVDEKLLEPRGCIVPPFDRVIGTSATAAALVCAVNGIPRADRDQADRQFANIEPLRTLQANLARLDVAARRKTPGIGPKRADLIVAGAAVFARSLEVFTSGRLHYSAAGVRDGVIADLAARRAGRHRSQLDSGQEKLCEDMASRYGVRLPHARQVARFAHQLFDALQSLHRIPAEYGRLLEAAGYLHDIGHFVSNTGHHKHSHYVVANSDLPGFTQAERLFIAVLCRYHRKSAPSGRHEIFQALSPEERRYLALLTPLLRLADSFDRGHEQRVRALKIEASGRAAVSISLMSESNTDLELWAAGRIADLFRASYQIPLTLQAVSE